MTETVVVTGASGFIGKAIVADLLAHGYRVRGTVRSEAKADQVRACVPADQLDRLEFTMLDLTSDDGWEAALAGADALLHTASPFSLQSPKDPQELIRPAVDGTLRALRAAHGAGVNRVVVTSSCVAIYNDSLRPGQTVLDETNWSPTGQPFTSAYDDSKTLAERAAWEFAEEHPEMRLSTVNPGVVWGTPADEHYGASLELVERFLAGSDPALPRVSMPVVDVADVATMHRRCLEVDDAAGQRFPACAGALTLAEAAQILSDNIASSKAKTRVVPDVVVKVGALFSSEMKAMAARLGKSGLVSGAKAEDVLGIEFISPEESLLRSAEFITAQ